MPKPLENPKKEDLLTTTEVARILKIAPGSVSNMRWRKIGIPFIKMGSSVRYRRTTVDEYIEKNTRSVADSDQKSERRSS